MLALSLSISTSGSPFLTSSPSFFSQRRILPVSIESDRRGIWTLAISVPSQDWLDASSAHFRRLPLSSPARARSRIDGCARSRARRLLRLADLGRESSAPPWDGTLVLSYPGPGSDDDLGLSGAGNHTP